MHITQPDEVVICGQQQLTCFVKKFSHLCHEKRMNCSRAANSQKYNNNIIGDLVYVSDYMIISI